jgi:hypothetical protein
MVLEIVLWSYGLSRGGIGGSCISCGSMSGGAISDDLGRDLGDGLLSGDPSNGAQLWVDGLCDGTMSRSRRQLVGKVTIIIVP